MRRTQLYLDNPLWEALRARAVSQKTTISELVRVAARERYFNGRDARAAAMREFVGSRGRAPDTIDSEQYVRSVRRSDRLERLQR